MSPEQLEQIQKTVSEQIKITVNGKIDRINDKLDNYIKEDNDWKERIMPEIQAVANVRGFGKVAVGLLAVGGTIVGLVVGIIKIIKG